MHGNNEKNIRALDVRLALLLLLPAAFWEAGARGGVVTGFPIMKHAPENDATGSSSSSRAAATVSAA